MNSVSPKIELIVGLGNPGAQYERSRHNAGFWMLDEVVRAFGGILQEDARFLGDVGDAFIGSHKLRLLRPTRFMNRSGESVGSMARYFQIEPESMLVVHDELDLEPGVIRLKKSGGHGGHNGLRDIVKHGGSPDFWRLRVGIGHPGHKSQVTSWVLGRAGADEEVSIRQSIDAAIRVLPQIVSGDTEAAMQALHS